MDYAELRGGNAADAEAWRDDYEGRKKLRLKHIVMNGRGLIMIDAIITPNSYIYSVTLINFSRADIR